MSVIDGTAFLKRVDPIAELGLVDAISREASRWHVAGVLPTHIVATWDVIERIAAQTDGHMRIGRETWRVFGIPVVVVTGLPAGTWALGTDIPMDAQRITPSVPEDDGTTTEETEP